MAVLQKIRNQGGVLVSIFVGVALLAFIVGDALSSSSQILNRSQNKVGEIAGERLSIQDYQALVNNNESAFKVIQNLPSLDDMQRQQVQENTWQMEVFRVIMGQEFEKTGIGVSQDEIHDRLIGDRIDPAIARFMIALGVDPTDRTLLNTVVQNILQAPGEHPYKVTWQLLEQQAVVSYQTSKYQTLLSKALYIPGAQVSELAADATSTVDISYVMKSYNTISDSTVTIAPTEIKEYYNTHQYLFKQQESRQITYVSFDINASVEDIQAIQEELEALKPEFEAASNVIEFANSATTTKAEPRFYKKGELGEELDAFLFSGTNDGSVHGPYLDNNAYHLLRVADRMLIPDSVRVRQIILAVDQTNVESRKNLADSLVQELRGGANFDLLAREFSADPNSAVNGGDIGWFTQDMLAPTLRDTLFLSRRGEIILLPSQAGFVILQVAGQTRPVQKVRVGIITKEISPSEQTINKVYNEARLFADNVNTTAEFDKAVTDKAQTKRYATLDKNDYSIAGIEKARELVRETYMSSSVGKILLKDRKTPIFECGDKYVVAVLSGINKEGTSPLPEVLPVIRRELTRKKKGEIIAKELQAAAAGSESLLSIAQKTSTEVLDATDISFASLQVPGVGIEPRVIAGVTHLDLNQLSTPIIGNQGVFMAVVTNKANSGEEETSPEDMQPRAQALRQLYNQRVLEEAISSILGASKIRDFRYKFY